MVLYRTGFGKGVPRRPGFAVSSLLAFGLVLCVGLATAASSGTNGDCESDLTCARSTKAAVHHEFSKGPNISDWRLSAPKSGVLAVSVSTSEPPQSFLDPTTGMEFVLVPGACYQTAAADGQPEREVCFDPYYIGAYEVTFDEYDRFAAATERKFPKDEGWGRGRRPVVNVCVYDALNFAKWLSRRSGGHYRLPTEVEWEHAARAGTMRAFPWGDELGVNRANCDGCGSQWDGELTAPVGQFAPNGWGIYDVVGNVGEWTCSMRDPDPDQSFENCDSIFETRRRAYRNGGWSDDAERLTMSFRDWNVAMRRTDDVGFRLVRECVDCKAGAAVQPEALVVQQRDRRAGGAR